jgi:hypothetical protein
MKKVLILAEGQTEETFVKRVLDPHLSNFNLAIIPTIIVTKRIKSGHHFKGGIPSYEKVKKEIQRLLGDSSAAMVTTMIDYYGLPLSFPGRPSVQGSNALERVKYIEDALSADIGDPRFLAYYSLHEFEALLFVSPSEIARAFSSPRLEQQIVAVRNAFATPEDINDDPVTAPSARLRSMYPRYSKPFFGWLIANRIGLQGMRDECHHFDEWLARLEKLGTAPN